MSEPIRVAHVVGKMCGGGVEAVVMNYYRHIDRSRVQFDFLVDEDSALVPREEIGSLGGRVFVVPPYQRLLAYMGRLEGLFSDEGWSIVHSHVNALSVFPLRAAARAGVPVRIAHSHSTAGKGEPVKNALKRLLRTQASRYPTHRLACSRYAGEWLFGKEVELEVVPNAIDMNAFAFDERWRSKARQMWNIEDGQVVIGHVGRLAPVKNQSFLIEVLSCLRKSGVDARLVLVGEGKDRIAIQNRAACLGLSEYMVMPGQMDSSLAYQGFDAFAFPSTYEGFGMAALEAQRAGLPCLLSDAITREVDVTGAVRFLPIDDPSAWADALCALRAGDRVPVRPERFSYYDIDAAAQKLAALYIALDGERAGK